MFAEGGGLPLPQLDDQQKQYESEVKVAADLEQFCAVKRICKEAKLVEEKLEHEDRLKNSTPAPLEPCGPVGTEDGAPLGLDTSDAMSSGLLSPAAATHLA